MNARVASRFPVLLLVAACLSAVPATHAGEHVAVFVTTDDPIVGPAALARAGITVVVYRLDGLEVFERTVSEGLPRDPVAAKREAMRRVHARPELKATLALAAKGLVEALRYGLNRVPAIVIDGHTVVYGERNVTRALRAYRGG